MRYQTTLSNGFSLVEVLVAISILLLVIIGPMGMITRSNNATSFASEQANAWFLAQEGIELAQKQRDDLLLESFNGSLTPDEPWAQFAKPTGDWSNCFSGTGCGLSIESGSTPSIAVEDCSTATCKLYIDNATTLRPSYVYDSSGTINTPYYRVIRMIETTDGREVEVTSTVTWRTGSLIASQKVESVTYLLNVYGKP